MIAHSTARRGGCFMNPRCGRSGCGPWSLLGRRRHDRIRRADQRRSRAAARVGSSSCARRPRAGTACSWRCSGSSACAGCCKAPPGQDGPRWLQVLSGVLVLVALVLACSATALVATAAWPVHELADEVAAGRRQRRCCTTPRAACGWASSITFVAVVVLALGATSSWWPEDASTSSGGMPAVEVTTGRGCGLWTAAERRSRHRRGQQLTGRSSSSRPATWCGCARSPPADRPQSPVIMKDPAGSNPADPS